jgi:hypothetical protein
MEFREDIRPLQSNYSKVKTVMCVKINITDITDGNRFCNAKNPATPRLKGIFYRFYTFLYRDKN